MKKKLGLMNLYIPSNGKLICPSIQHLQFVEVSVLKIF